MAREGLTTKLFAAILPSLALPAAAEAPRLSLPIACEPGKTCFIQSYVDVDAGPGALDFACGSATYDGHKGTDFRILSAAVARRGVDVLASAEGVVRGARDGVEDVFVTPQNRGEIAGRECGNGVVLTHPDDWETQYCHMQKGSVAVKAGDKVSRGQRLGSVGYSGLAEFAHVHLEVRHDGKPVDPFSGKTNAEACAKDASTLTGLWNEDAIRGFPYANGQIIGAGFTSDPKLTERMEVDDALPPPVRTSATFVVFVRAANLRTGDRIRLTLKGPQGVMVDNTTDPVDRAKASYRGFAGKKLKAADWPAGGYSGTAAIIRDGSVLAEKNVEMELR